jgi:predicted RNase H-like HicB family nuclease
MRHAYPAIIDVNPDAVHRTSTKGEMLGRYGVTFPDIPGCVSAGDTIAEAMANAREALVMHLEVMAENGVAAPEPRAFEVIETDPNLKIAAIALVEVQVASPPVRVNISIDAGLLEEIDAVSSNRSAFLADAARVRLGRNPDAGVPVRNTMASASSHLTQSGAGKDRKPKAKRQA